MSDGATVDDMLQAQAGPGQTVVAGRTHREVTRKEMAFDIVDEKNARGEKVYGPSDFDAKKLRKFERQKKHKEEKERVKLLKKADGVSMAQLLADLPAMLDKFLFITSISYIENKNVGVIDLTFGNIGHARRFWALAASTSGTYGEYEDVAKFKDDFPHLLLMEADDEGWAPILKEHFPDIEIDEAFCKENMPVMVKILDDAPDVAEEDRKHGHLKFVRPHHKSLVEEVHEDVTPQFVIDRIEAEEGPRGVRRYFAEKAVLDASARLDERLDRHPAIKEQIDDYIENNAGGVLTVGTEDQRAHISFPYYPPLATSATTTANNDDVDDNNDGNGNNNDGTRAAAGPREVWRAPPAASDVEATADEATSEEVTVEKATTGTAAVEEVKSNE
jgi:hypothetical protein